MDLNQICYFGWLPSEVLKVVANGAGGQAIASLWRSCNRNINRKLAASSGVDVFDLWQPTRVSLAWPQLLCHLKGLKTLRIELRKDVGAAPMFCSTLLSTLPSGLQEIVFHFREAEECWLRPFERQNQAPFKPDYQVVDFDFAAHFPDLQTLKLIAPSPSQNQMADGKLQDGELVPIYGLLRNSSLSLLPRSLTCLELPSNNTITAVGLKELPPSREHLNLMWVGAGWNRSTTIPPFDASAISMLPLRTLNLSRYNRGLPSTFFQDLPATLTHLNLNNYRQMLSAQFSDLPIGLLHLDLEFMKSFQGEHFKLLPPKLEYLNAGSLENVSDKELLQLPASLTYLDLNSARLHSGDSLALLPTNLRSLCLGNWTTATFADDNDQTITNAQLAGLPRSLTHLDLSSNNSISNDAFLHLPPGIATLILYQNKRIDGSAVSLFPKSLHQLITRPMRFVRIDQMHGFTQQTELWEEIKKNGENGWISGHSAVAHGQLEVLKWLDKHGYRIQSDRHSSTTLVALANQRGHPHIATWLNSHKNLF